jgi:two-component sensor histidine kinase
LTTAPWFPDHRWGRFGLIVGFWTLVAGIYVLSSTLITWTVGSPQPMTPMRALFTLLGWYTWIPGTYVVLALVRRFPIDREQGLWPVGLHLVAAPFVSLLASSLFAGMRGAEELLGGRAIEGGLVEYTASVFLRSVTLDSVIYVTILLGVHAFEYYRRYRERELRAWQLERELSEARLQALRLQLQPHFLFNTFHTIAMLVRQGEDDQAVDTIAVLSEFLRYVLDHTGAQEVSLRRELDFLQSYLAIEHIRFQDHLKVDLDVDDEALGARVPNLILQPLVENAIRHGIEPHRRVGRIEVTARREGDRLRLRVRDDGAGLPDDWRLEAQQGIGLSNTRARLERLYGEAHRLELTNAPGGGLMVTIVIPYRPDDASPGDLPLGDGTASRSARRAAASDTEPAVTA